MSPPDGLLDLGGRGPTPAWSFDVERRGVLLQDQVERLSGFDTRTYVYRFALDDGGTVIVAWADTGLRLPGDGMATTPARISLGSDQPVRVEWAVTTGSEPAMELVEPESREVVLALGQIPALIGIGE